MSAAISALAADESRAPTPELAEDGPESRARRALYEFTRNKMAVAGVLLLLCLIGFCFLGPVLYHTDQVHTNILAVKLPPSGAHPLGTDDLGYDELGRLMVGGQSTLEIGLGAGLFAALVGTAWGAVAGYFGGVVDAIMMRIVDGLLSIPTLVLLIVLTTIVRPSVWVLIVLLGSISWLIASRLVRAEALTLKTRLYMQAFRAYGGRAPRALARHVVPNTLGTIIVFSTFLVADSILFVAYLSFLGLGLQAPATTWGDMLTSGINYVYDGYWWLIYPPGIAIILLVMSFNLIGDGLRDVFALQRGRKR